MNDGFTSLAPDDVRDVACSILTESYRSIDCIVYMTVNSYIYVPGSDLAQLIWAPAYSDRAQDALVEFVNAFGRKWFDYLESHVGPFNNRQEISEKEHDVFRGTSIINPRFLPKM